MRCFMLRDGHIAAVEILTQGPDESLIEQAQAHYARRKQTERFDGFEVWNLARRVHVWSEKPDPPADGLSGARAGL